MPELLGERIRQRVMLHLLKGSHRVARARQRIEMMSASLRFSSCPRVYQQRKAVDSLTVMICGTVVIEILEARKIFSGRVLGTRSVTLFESRITKSVTVKVTKFVFLTVAV